MFLTTRGVLERCHVELKDSALPRVMLYAFRFNSWINLGWAKDPEHFDKEGKELHQ